MIIERKISFQLKLYSQRKISNDQRQVGDKDFTQKNKKKFTQKSPSAPSRKKVRNPIFSFQ